MEGSGWKATVTLLMRTKNAMKLIICSMKELIFMNTLNGTQEARTRPYYFCKDEKSFLLSVPFIRFSLCSLQVSMCAMAWMCEAI
jgi:hypothetical protein